MLPFICFPSIYAQDYAYAHYDVKEGLASSVVYCAVQDKEGFMWFGTEAGLSRFDGANFKNFTIEDGLPDNEILKLFVDSKSRLWIIPFKNAICYYYKGKIYTSKNDPILKAFKISSYISSIAEDKEGNIVILEDHTVHFISKDSITQTATTILGAKFNGIHVGVDASGSFRLAIESGKLGLCFVDFNINHPRMYRNLGGYTPNSVNSVIVSDDIEIYRINEKYIYLKNGMKTTFPVPQGNRSISIIEDSILCINSSQGSYIYNANQNKLINVFLGQVSVNGVFSDDSQNWWFCTNKGVYRLLSTASKRFPFEVNGKPSTIYCIGKLGSSMYFGSDNYRLITLKDNQFTIDRIFRGFTPGRITALLNTYPNYFILGGDDGIMVLRPYVRFSLPAQAIKSIYRHRSELFVSTNNGVEKVNLNNVDSFSPAWHGRSTCSWASDSKLYVGTLNGLYSVEASGKQVFLGNQFTHLTAKISALAADKNNTLWVATYGFGLIGLRHDSIRYNISSKDGLSSNTCRALFIDSNTVWVATDKGLDKIQLSASGPQIIKFSTADGLPSAVINCIYVDGSMVYTGSSEGMTQFDESQISQQSNCRIRITGVQIGTDDKYYDTSNFELRHNYTQLRFDYSAISYKSAGDITYHYRLLGLSNAWATTGSSFLSYPSLPSGGYVLELYAVNKFGVKSNTLSIPFSVKKLFWETLWFQVLAFVVVLAAIWIFIVLRIRWLKRKERAEIQVKRRMMEMEQMALKAQMNPHFIFNCLNSIQQYVIEKDFAAVNKFITDFASLIRKTLEASSKAEISLEEELEYISTYLRVEKERLEDKFSFQIHLGAEVKPSDYYLPPMLLQPCLENSIRHGIRYREDNLGKIDIHIRKDSAYLYCIIEDNGVGRRLAQEYQGRSPIEYQSKGTELTSSRIEMLSMGAEHKATITWEDILDGKGEVAGTGVTLRFPLEMISKA